MYFTLNFILQYLVSLYCALIISFCLTKKYSRAQSLAIYSLISLALFGFKFSYFEHPYVLTFVSFALQATLILFTLLGFSDSLFKKLVVFSIILFCNMLSELIALLILESISSYTMALEPDTKEFSVAILLTLPVLIFLNLLFLSFWKYAISKKNNTIYLLFSIIPMLQLAITASIFTPVLIGGNVINTSLTFICSLVAILTTIILLYVILRRQEKQTIQATYMELQELYQIESEYYEDLKSHHEDFAKIRHDYHSQLSVLYMLISSNQIDAAKELVTSMKKNIKT